MRSTPRTDPGPSGSTPGVPGAIAGSPAGSGRVDDAALLRHLVEVIGRLSGLDLAGGVDDDALTGAVEVLHRAETMLAAEKLRRLAEVDARAAYTSRGARSTGDLLGGFGLTRGEARSQVQTAQALERLPAMADRFARGQIGVGQAAIAARALSDLLDSGDEARDRATAAGLDRLVATEGPALDRRELGRTVDRWAQQHTDGDRLAARERRAHQRRHLWAGPTADGDILLEGRLTPAVHAQLGALLDPLARSVGPDDDRTIGQRRHDALATILDHAAAITHHPTSDDRGPGGSGGTAGGAPGSGTADGAAKAAGAETAAVSPGRPQVLLIVTPDALHGLPGAPPAELDGHGPVSSATARQLCCDADLTTVLIAADGTPLDIGRAHRLPTRRQRLAVTARDRHCVGCGAPARRCQVHHIHWWRHGGATDLANLCLLCPSCHTNVHHFGWIVTHSDATYRAGPSPEPDRRPT